MVLRYLNLIDVCLCLRGKVELGFDGHFGNGRIGGRLDGHFGGSFDGFIVVVIIVGDVGFCVDRIGIVVVVTVAVDAGIWMLIWGW